MDPDTCADGVFAPEVEESEYSFAACALLRQEALKSGVLVQALEREWYKRARAFDSNEAFSFDASPTDSPAQSPATATAGAAGYSADDGADEVAETGHPPNEGHDRSYSSAHDTVSACRERLGDAAAGVAGGAGLERVHSALLPAHFPLFQGEVGLF